VDYQQTTEPNQPTVLIVEDDVVLRNPLGEYLRAAGYVIFEAANSAEAIAVFSAKISINAVFSDIRMAGPMDGLGLARWIRARHPGVRIALTSGADNNKARAEAVAETFIAKPYHVADIAALIGQLLAATPGPAASSPEVSSEAPSTGERRRSRSPVGAQPRRNER
jgi:CheY-like chemotaxis protein